MLPNTITEQKGKGKQHQGIKATKAFEYENTRRDFKYCYSSEK